MTLWTVARQVLLPMEFSRQECWSGVPLPTPASWPRDRNCVSYASCIDRPFFTTSATWEAPTYTVKSTIRQVYNSIMVCAHAHGHTHTHTHTHTDTKSSSSILDWKISRAEEPGWLLARGLQRVSRTQLSTSTYKLKQKEWLLNSIIYLFSICVDNHIIFLFLSVNTVNVLMNF